MDIALHSCFFVRPSLYCNPLMRRVQHVLKTVSAVDSGELRIIKYVM